MTRTSFDTLTTTKLLQEAGITENQAEAITFAIKSGLEGELATKIDILNLESKLTQSIAETKIDIFNLESKLTQSIAETNRNVAAVKLQLDKHDERFDKMDERFDKMDERLNKQDIVLASFKNNFKWMYAFGSTIIVILTMSVIPGILEVFAS